MEKLVRRTRKGWNETGMLNLVNYYFGLNMFFFSTILFDSTLFSLLTILSRFILNYFTPLSAILGSFWSMLCCSTPFHSVIMYVTIIRGSYKFVNDQKTFFFNLHQAELAIFLWVRPRCHASVLTKVQQKHDIKIKLLNWVWKEIEFDKFCHIRQRWPGGEGVT